MKPAILAAVLLAAGATRVFADSYDDLNDGIQLRNHEKWQPAIVRLSKAIDAADLAPDLQRVARMDRAEAYLQVGEVEKSIADYSAVLAINPDDIEARHARAFAHDIHGDYDLAQKDVEPLLASKPVPASSRILAAQIFRDQGNYDKAIATLQQVSIQHPNDAWVDFQIGIVNFDFGRFADAESNFETARGKNGGLAGYSWLWKQLARLNQGKEISGLGAAMLDNTQWPWPLVNAYQAAASMQPALDDAVQGKTQDIARQTCEAAFYVGEWRALHQDLPGAKALLEKAVNDCPRNLEEWREARRQTGKLP